MSTTLAARSREPRRHSTRRWQLPSAFTVLAGVALMMWVLTFMIPTGCYGLDGTRAADGGFIGRHETGELLGAAGVSVIVIAIGIRFIAPLLAILFVLCPAFVAVGAAVS